MSVVAVKKLCYYDNTLTTLLLLLTQKPSVRARENFPQVALACLCADHLTRSWRFARGPTTALGHETISTSSPSERSRYAINCLFCPHFWSNMKVWCFNSHSNRRTTRRAFAPNQKCNPLILEIAKLTLTYQRTFGDRDFLQFAQVKLFTIVTISLTQFHFLSKASSLSMRWFCASSCSSGKFTAV